MSELVEQSPGGLKGDTNPILSERGRGKKKKKEIERAERSEETEKKAEEAERVREKHEDLLAAQYLGAGILLVPLLLARYVMSSFVPPPQPPSRELRLTD